MNKKVFELPKEQVLEIVRPKVKKDLEAIMPNIKVLDVEWCMEGLKIWYLEDISK
jgi:hypothetical protein